MTARAIPVSYLSKMVTYDIELQAGVTIKTRVLDRVDVIDMFITELKSFLAGHLVVGLDVKSSQDNADLLILCAGSQCLIIQLGFTLLPRGLWNFLAEKTICFVGIQISQKIEKLRGKWLIDPTYGYHSMYHPTNPEGWGMEMREGREIPANPETGVELGYLAARVLKKPSLSKCTVLKELVKEVGIDDKVKVSTIIESTEDCPNWDADVLSHEEIKGAIQDAYNYYVVGKLILDICFRESSV